MSRCAYTIDRIVLFLADRGVRLEEPIRVELRTADGDLLAEHGFVD